VFIPKTEPREAPEVFVDVDQSHENADAIESLRSNEIVRGFDDETFRPESVISRAAFTKIVIMAFFDAGEISACLSENVGNASSTAFFPDVPVIEWFAPYVCTAKVHGVIRGFPDGYFRPEKNISFAEAAKIIGVVSEDIQEGTDVWYTPFVEFLSAKRAIPVSISSLTHNITRGEMAEIMYRLREGVTDKESLVNVQ